MEEYISLDTSNMSDEELIARSDFIKNVGNANKIIHGLDNSNTDPENFFLALPHVIDYICTDYDQKSLESLMIAVNKLTMHLFKAQKHKVDFND